MKDIVCANSKTGRCGVVTLRGVAADAEFTPEQARYVASIVQKRLRTLDVTVSDLQTAAYRVQRQATQKLDSPLDIALKFKSKVKPK
ncbi:MAG: hypothetical protein JXA21_10450 [Anaerolineae bacterium]|nr:hypothetical protein [Anaerolineae bacterium]